MKLLNGMLAFSTSFALILSNALMPTIFSDSNELCLTFHLPQALNDDLPLGVFGGIGWLNGCSRLPDKDIGHSTQERGALDLHRGDKENEEGSMQPLSIRLSKDPGLGNTAGSRLSR